MDIQRANHPAPWNCTNCAYLIVSNPKSGRFQQVFACPRTNICRTDVVCHNALECRASGQDWRLAANRSYAQLGEDLGMSEAGVKWAVQQMRQRHGELLREEIAQTVARPEEIVDKSKDRRRLSISFYPYSVVAQRSSERESET